VEWGFFFPPILLCSDHTCDDYPQEKLAKFGYRSEMDIEKKFNPTISWRPAGTSVLIFFGEISQCGHHILSKKPKRLKVAIFRQKILGGGQNIRGF
jgi:hypothetical protein